MTSREDYEFGYKLAYELASNQLAEIDDISEVCLRSGARYEVKDSREVLILEYLNRSYQITLPDVEISFQNSDAEGVPLRDKILMLHYLTQARGTPLANKLITYKELPEGTSYYPTFSKRAIRPVVDYFGNEPDRLLDVAGMLGGRTADYGDVAVTIDAFRRVPITLVLWRADDEFPAEGNIMFDSTICDYLPVEDINVLCEAVAWRLVKLLKAGGEHYSGSRN